MLITVHVYIWIYSANKTDSVKVKTAQLAPPAARAHANPAQFPVRTVGFRTILNLFRQLASYYWVFVSPISTKTKCSYTHKLFFPLPPVSFTEEGEVRDGAGRDHRVLIHHWNRSTSRGSSTCPTLKPDKIKDPSLPCVQRRVILPLQVREITTARSGFN
jgi:hypothetical protein